MIPTQINDYSQFDSPPYLLQQFVGTDVQKMCALVNQECEDLEKAVYSVLDNIGLDKAFSILLDVWGVRLGLPRSGRDDDSYRTLLKLQSYINTGKGTPEELIASIRTLYNASEIHYVLDAPAKVIIRENGQLGIYIFNLWVTDDDAVMVTENNEALYFQQLDTSEQIIIKQIVPSGVGLTIESI